ncbi:hypothetical protein M8C21_012930 [Ambrosia artemisiifolia]|uniref:Uncharacterized protein n=1 Tax=Ambrosia artemisiifolia TaxID=4212 RepID=A0AAD5G675_AMBAR|nr:hypothetical protein M8C21_012930 [Ambrosia artemisiifolia]
MVKNHYKNQQSRHHALRITTTTHQPPVNKTSSVNAMNSSLNPLHHHYLPKPFHHRYLPKPFHHRYLPKPSPHHHLTTTTTFSSLRRRRHFRRRHPNNNTHIPTNDTVSSPPDSKLHLIIDLHQYIPNKGYKTLLKTAQLQFHNFIQSGNDAVHDLRTLITVDTDRRVMVSCKKSTVYFLGQLIALSLVTVVTFKELRREGGGSVSPLASVEDSILGYSGSMVKNWEKVRKKEVPDWWPEARAAPLEGIDKEENQRKANWLIRAIMDYRTSGKDIQEDDIILLRRICRMSGVNVVIDTSNSRDSIYRASVDFTLNTCGRVPSHSTFVQIDGEDAREFIAGLADNIGLERPRAARIVAAAVAARTRSWLLQAWALEMQGKHIEAVDELSKLCLIHRIFPPDEGSPEMEMVARGLEKHLKLEQRVYLLKMLIGVSTEENRRSLVEALGLEMPAGSVDDEQESMLSLHEDDQER